MNEIPTREIMWNLSHPLNTVIMYGLFAISLIILSSGILQRIFWWSSGKPAPQHTGKWWVRFHDMFTWALLQRGVSREREAGIFHFLIYFGFLVLTFTTTMVLIDHDFGIRIYQGPFYLAITILSDVFGLGVIIGVAAAAYRRKLKRPDLIHSRSGDWLMLGSIALLCFQGFILEGLRIKVTEDPWQYYSPVGYVFSQFFWGISNNNAKLLHFITWWFHAATLFVGIALLPYTKFFHIISSSLNLYFRRSDRPRGALPFPGDLEKLIETATDELQLGISTIKDFSWKQLLDLDACTSCGRCQDVCPAYASGKPLSPKWMILDSRNHFLSLASEGKFEGAPIPSQIKKLDQSLLGNLLLKKNASVGGETWRGENKAVQSAVRKIGGNLEAAISGEVMDPNVFWSCNTCYACVEACPVGINHVDIIVENRRNMVLMQGAIPHEAQGTLRGLEAKGNPYGPAEDRTKWMDGLNVRILKPGDEVDYLYWVGCVSAYDPRKQKIARSLVSLMNKAGLSFGILGTAEGCTGDPARRLGEENLFQSLAKKNIETLISIKFSSLVANCPHCFNTIKNEYPQLGNLGEGRSPEIIHHSTLLKRLLDQGKLSLKDNAQEFTFHDPCYLGRYNGEYDAPRDSLKSIKGLKILEMDKSKEKGLCCGAGGGHFWMDMKLGERVNAIRTDQAAATGANNIATACPFCLQMMEDGVKITNRDETMTVKDIAEVLVDNLE